MEPIVVEEVVVELVELVEMEKYGMIRLECVWRSNLHKNKTRSVERVFGLEPQSYSSGN